MNLLSSKPSKAIRLLLMVLFVLLMPLFSFGQSSETFYASGTFTVPCYVTSITVEAWGGGGGGGGADDNPAGGSGGGGGGYSSYTISVTPGQNINYTIGGAGTGGKIANGGKGGDGLKTTFLGLTANGGKGGLRDRGNAGAGGTASGGTTNVNGTAGVKGTFASGAAGGFSNGLDGGASRNSNGNGNAAINPGSGGGGGFRSGGPKNDGGNGASGQIKITYTKPTGTITQPTCVTATGSVVLSGLPATGTWTIYQNGTSIGTNTGSTKSVIGLAPGTYKFSVSNGSCNLPDTGDLVIKPLVKTTLKTTGWDNGTPTIDKNIVFDAPYSLPKDGNLEGCSCQVNTGKSVIINEGATLKIYNGVKVLGTGSLTFENNSSLIQINEDSAINSGSIIYKRQSNVIRNSDYTYWSSPVALQTLSKVSPGTTSPYTFWSFNAAGNSWVPEDPLTPMEKGKGYIIRGPEFFPNPLSPLIQAPFEGIPHNGEFTIDIAGVGTSNLIGNPYPSALDAESFLIANREVLQGTLYFWTHNTPIRAAQNTSNEGSGDLVYITDDYASYNLTGGVGTEIKKITTIGNTEPSGENKSNRPTGKIASGQGFFATGKAAGKATFKNTMRVGVDGIAGDNKQFFKTTQSSKNTNAIEKNRVWLNLTNDKGAFKQVLVGYITDATNGYDNALDGANNNGNQFINFYSINDDKNLTIQARALPFDENDVVPLGYSSTIQGSFSISIDEVDGLLTSENIYLEDKSNNTIHDLKKAAYTFDTEKGTFNERFVLRYTDRTLASADFELNDSSVLIAKDKNELKIKSQTEIISQIAVFDLLGRKVFEKTAINSNEFQTSAIRLSNQVVVVKVTLTNGEVISKKVVY